MGKQIKILLDTDIGSDIDDAVCLAYLLANPDCESLGITTVTGEALKRAKLASVLCKVAGTCVRQAVRDLLSLPGPERPHAVIERLRRAERLVRALHSIPAVDGARMCRFRDFMKHTSRDYAEVIGAENPSLLRLRTLTRKFPALVVPMELRESSEQVTCAVGGARGPIVRMLETLARVSRGGNPLWYARGLIISMVSRPEDIDAGLQLVARAFGSPAIPVIPLFEGGRALREGAAIMKTMLARPMYREAARQRWDGRVEVMLGYSDSAKEMGVLSIRLAIAHFYDIIAG